MRRCLNEELKLIVSAGFVKSGRSQLESGRVAGVADNLRMQAFGWYVLAAACEIAGCYTAWMWLRLGRSGWWLAPGVVSLVVFALALTRVDSAFAGRAFAAYGGIYIVCSLLWMALVERTAPRPADLAGALVCLGGAAIILYGAVR